jgi:hypothetical protein
MNIFRIFGLILLLLVFISGCGDSNPVESEDAHFEAIGLFAIFETDTMVKYIDGVVYGDFKLGVGVDSPVYELMFLEEDGDISIPPTDEWSLGWEIEDNSIATTVSDQENHDQYQIQFSGLKEGQTAIKIQIFHNDHKDFESEGIPLIVDTIVEPE